MKAQVQIPKKLIPVFIGPARYRTCKGGRGSAKTRSFAKMTAIRAYQFAEEGINGVVLCGREFMNSLDESSMEEVKMAIRSEPWLNDYFDIGEKYIRTKNGRVKYVFSGLRHNLDSIKSKARILLAWLDEAEAVSEAAYKKLIPTVREEGSEIWITWNPEKKGSPTDKRFGDGKGEETKHATMNWSDNPYFPEVLNRERLRDEKYLSPEEYAHIWEGAYLEVSTSQVLKGKWTVSDFKPSDDWGGPYFGADWGYSVDPTTLVKCYLEKHDRDDYTLYIEKEAYDNGVETLEIPKLFDSIKESRDHLIRGDSARPEIISYLLTQGFKIEKSKKGAGSVIDGVDFFKRLRRIVINERCKYTIEEAKSWSYKTDKLTGEPLPILKDGDDHIWDAVRYALEPFIKSKKTKRVFIGKA